MGDNFMLLYNELFETEKKKDLSLTKPFEDTAETLKIIDPEKSKVEILRNLNLTKE